MRAGSASADNPEMRAGSASADNPEMRAGSVSADNPEMRTGYASSDNPEVRADSGSADNPEMRAGSVSAANPEMPAICAANPTISLRTVRTTLRWHPPSSRAAAVVLPSSQLEILPRHALVLVAGIAEQERGMESRDQDRGAV